MSLFGFLGQVFALCSFIWIATRGYAMVKDYLERGKKLNELEKQYDELLKRRSTLSVIKFLFETLNLIIE